MRYDISDRMAKLKPSAIREILKYASDPEVISLAAGDPAPESLPYETVSSLLGGLLDTKEVNPLLYSQSEGYQPFRDLMVGFVNKNYNIETKASKIIITTGAQQAIDLFTKVVCNDGDTIICENPSFVGALNTFRSYNANLVGVEMQDDGMDIDALEKAIKENKNVKFIYTIPNFHNPTGITTSLEKRKAIYKLALENDILILEDNPYGDLRISGQSIPTIKSFDEDDIVFYTGSFSKIISSGMRLGYFIAPNPLMAKLAVAKQCTDVHSSMISQMLCYNFLKETSFDDHIENLIKIYKEKSDLMQGLMDEHFPKEISHTTPEGGLFIWCTMPEGIDAAEVAKRAVEEKKVCIVPGSAFLTDTEEKSNCFRTNFSKVSKDDITKGIITLAELLKEYV